MSQPQTICIMEIFKDFFGCKSVLVATHQNSQSIQRLFRLQNCLSRKSSKSWKNSKTFSPAKLSSPQIIDILKIFSPAKISQQQPIIIPKKFKDFFACKVVLAANHRYLGNIQRLFRLQNCLSRKSSISWEYSKTFSPAKLSQPQTIDIPEIFKDFFGFKFILVASIKILKILKDSIACKFVSAANHLYPGIIQRLFRLQNCLSSKPSKI